TEVVEDQGRIVGDDRLGFFLLVSAPEREPDEVVVLSGRHAGEAVKSVLDPLEVPNRGVILEVLIAVTGFMGLLCSKVASLANRLSEEQAGRFPSRTRHAKSSEKFGVFCTTLARTSTATAPTWMTWKPTKNAWSCPGRVSRSSRGSTSRTSASAAKSTSSSTA